MLFYLAAPQIPLTAWHKQVQAEAFFPALSEASEIESLLLLLLSFKQQGAAYHNVNSSPTSTSLYMEKVTLLSVYTLKQ